LNAIFRLHGSYEALKYGTLLDGLSDLTGGITESIAIRQDPTACGRALSKLLDMTSLITCTVNNNQQQQVHNVSKRCNSNFFKYFTHTYIFYLRYVPAQKNSLMEYKWESITDYMRLKGSVYYYCIRHFYINYKNIKRNKRKIFERMILISMYVVGGNFWRGSGAISKVKESTWAWWRIYRCLGKRWA